MNAAIKYPQGSTGYYVGEKTATNVAHGEGIHIFPNGDTYRGTWCAGVLHGRGMTKNARKTFLGNFEHGVAQGPCEYFSNTSDTSDTNDTGDNAITFVGMFKDGKRSGFGALFFKDDSYVYGNWTDNKLNGFGVWTSSKDEVYSGNFLNGVRHGCGTLQIRDERYYCRTWTNGRLHGQATVIIGFENCVTYESVWEHGRLKKMSRGTKEIQGEKLSGLKDILFSESDDEEKEDTKEPLPAALGVGGEPISAVTRKRELHIAPDGSRYVTNPVLENYGSIVRPDGTMFEGSWKTNKETGEKVKDGYGAEVYSDGCKYEGYFVNGRKCGTGMFKWPRESYKGEWKDDEMHGRGKLIARDNLDRKKTYVGEFKFGKRDGFGKCTLGDGSVYEGQWRQDQRHGWGSWLDAGRGTWYVGEWHSDACRGNGTTLSADGTLYVGEHLAGLPHGRGKRVQPRGGCYEGTFFGGELNGLIRITYPDGSCSCVEYVMGVEMEVMPNVLKLSDPIETLPICEPAYEPLSTPLCRNHREAECDVVKIVDMTKEGSEGSGCTEYSEFDKSPSSEEQKAQPMEVSQRARDLKRKREVCFSDIECNKKRI